VPRVGGEGDGGVAVGAQQLIDRRRRLGGRAAEGLVHPGLGAHVATLAGHEPDQRALVLLHRLEAQLAPVQAVGEQVLRDVAQPEATLAQVRSALTHGVEQAVVQAIEVVHEGDGGAGSETGRSSPRSLRTPRAAAPRARIPPPHPAPSDAARPTAPGQRAEGPAVRSISASTSGLYLPRALPPARSSSRSITGLACTRASRNPIM
jgi:hypothetical protein